jgi:hypothetical protein
MFSFVPIHYELVASALAGAQSIDIFSMDAAPLKAGQKFVMKSGATLIEVILAADALVLADAPTTLNVLPLADSIVAGASTVEDRHPRTGNRLDQTVMIERFASINLTEPKKYDESNVQGDQQSIQLVVGRWARPYLTDYPWPLVEMKMQYQQDNVSFVEGTFFPNAPSQSRLGMQTYFGDRCKGRFIKDSRARVVRGQVTDVCC